MSKDETGDVDTVFVVPHTHYDATWVFTKEDYFYIYIDLIMKKVIELLDNNDFKFLIEQTFLLEEIEKRYPEIFSKIKENVKNKRIEIAGGERLMADTMLTQEETLIREILHGKKYVKEKFGVDVPVMWQADSFGLNAQLPQIYKKSGYKWVAFRRGCPKNKPSEFLWEGLDGTRILAHWMPLGYRAGLDLAKLEESYRILKNLALTNNIMMPSGSGSMAPLPEIINLVEQWNNTNRTKMKIAVPSEFFEALEGKTNDAPVWKGEMYSSRFSYIFPDCCSSRIWIKKNLRRYESWLLSFERFLTALKILNPAYHTTQYISELKDMWDKVLFLGFHDVVPGTGMDSAYDEVKEYIGFLKTKLSYLYPKILSTIVDEDSAQETYGDIVVFNPLSWDVSNWVEVDLNFDEGTIGKIGGLKCGDEEIDVEVIRFTRYEDESLRYARIGFIANVPAMGYKIYAITKDRKKRYGENFIKVKGNKIVTNKFKLSFDPQNGLVDILIDDEKICRANELVLEEECGDLYYHKESMGIPIKTESGEGFEFGSFRMKNFLIEKSPLRRIIKIDTDYYCLRWPYRLTKVLKAKVWRHNYLKVSKKIIVYRDLPRIDFITTVKNNHPRLRLRVRFLTDLKIPEYTCESQFGAVNRPTNYYYYNPEGWMDKPAGVFPSLRWIDYSNGRYGITVVNNGNPENEVRDGNVYITLLRGVGVLSSDGKAGPIIPVPDARETKTYTFRYSLYPHKGDWKTVQSYKAGYEFNYNLVALQLPANKKFRKERSFMRIEPDNVVMTALKPAESSDGFIIRFYEASGVETEATISLFKEPSRVMRTNLLEEEEEKLEVEGNSIKLTLRPFEIATLKIVF